MNRKNDLRPYMFEQSINTSLVVGCLNDFCQRIKKKTMVIMDNSSIQVAPHLTVVPAPPLREAFERMRGTPPLLGWYPPRRRHVQREEFPDRPTMIGDPCSH